MSSSKSLWPNDSERPCSPGQPPAPVRAAHTLLPRPSVPPRPLDSPLHLSSQAASSIFTCLIRAFWTCLPTLPRYHPSPPFPGLGGGDGGGRGVLEPELGGSIGGTVIPAQGNWRKPPCAPPPGAGARTGCGGGPATRASPYLSGHLPGI